MSVEQVLALLIVGLGTARVTALITRDGITENLRDMFFHSFPPENNPKLGWFYQDYRKSTKEERAEWKAKGLTLSRLESRWIDSGMSKSRKAHWLGQLVSCPMCTSVWIAAANYGLFYNWSDPMIVVNSFLAVAWVGAVGVIKAGWV